MPVLAPPRGDRMVTRSQAQSPSIDIVPATQDSDARRDQGERDLVRELERAAGRKLTCVERMIAERLARTEQELCAAHEKLRGAREVAQAAQLQALEALQRCEALQRQQDQERAVQDQTWQRHLDRVEGKVEALIAARTHALRAPAADAGAGEAAADADRQAPAPPRWAEQAATPEHQEAEKVLYVVLGDRAPAGGPAEQAATLLQEAGVDGGVASAAQVGGGDTGRPTALEITVHSSEQAVALRRAARRLEGRRIVQRVRPRLTAGQLRSHRALAASPSFQLRMRRANQRGEIVAWLPGGVRIGEEWWTAEYAAQVDGPPPRPRRQLRRVHRSGGRAARDPASREATPQPEAADGGRDAAPPAAGAAPGAEAVAA